MGRLIQPKEYDRQFGQTLRWLRLHKQVLSPSSRKRMRQTALQNRLNDIWMAEIGSYRFLRIHDIEKGNVHITRILAEFAAQAIDATPLERALLLQAAGYNGWAEYIVTELFSTSSDFPVAIGSLASGDLTMEDVEEIARLVIVAIKQQNGMLSLDEMNDLAAEDEAIEDDPEGNDALDENSQEDTQADSQ